MPRRIDRLAPEERASVDADIELICQRFVGVLRKINGRVPVRVLDRWLDVERRMQRFAATWS
jgi:hypothetical protein